MIDAYGDTACSPSGDSQTRQPQLGASDSTRSRFRYRIRTAGPAQNIALAAAMDKRLEPMEKRFNEKLDRLTTTLDRFLKRMNDVEEEFTFMKNDVNRIKAVLREKLGLTID